MRRVHLRLGRRGAAMLALIVAAAAVAIVVINGSANGNGNGGVGQVGSTATGSATVQRRNLVARDTESGTLSYADPQTVYNSLSGTVTSLPSVGSVIRPGQTLFTVDNVPVLLLDGRVPAFRDLTASDISGPDVYELNRNLVRLGYNPDGIIINSTWQDATTAGVDALQLHLGETENGTLSLGQVVFLHGSQLVSSQTATVGSTAASYRGDSGDTTVFVGYTPGTSTDQSDATDQNHAGGSGGGTTTSTTTTPSTTSTTTPTGTTTGTTTTSSGSLPSGETLQALIALLKAETAELQKAIAQAKGSSNGGGAPAGGASSTGGGGGTPTDGTDGGGAGGGAATAILATSSTKLVVTVDLDASLQSEAKLHEAVTVEMPNGSTVGGHISQISSVAQSSSSDTGGDGSSPDGSGGTAASTVPITITLDKRARGAGLDEAAVSVNFQQAKAKHVLSIPVTALLAKSGSQFAVQEAAAPHKLLPVRTGLFAAGYVEISGAGIHPGLQVTDSQG